MMDDICKQDGNFYDMEDYFWRNETEFKSFYKMKIVGYLDLTFCIIVVISNAFVVMVFSRKSMKSSMNTIFTQMAITETLAGLSYAPRAWHEFLSVTECSIPQHRTYFWEEISILSYITAFMFRTIGVWLAVMLAVWRYIAVIHPLKERRWCNPEITRNFIKLGYVFGVLMAIPPFLALQAGPAHKFVDENGCPTSNYTIAKNKTIYEFQMPLENYPVPHFVTFSFYGVFLKLLPSVAFTFISYRLIIRLLEVKKQRVAMISQQLGKNTDRTTKILVLILALFVIGEVPHGILCILNAYYGPAFFWRYAHHGLEIFTTLTHLSECFNFIIYYAMSQKFRKTFKALISCKNNEFGRIRKFGQNYISRSKIINKLSINSNQVSSITTINAK